MKTNIVVIIFFFLSSLILAQGVDYSKEPGYFEFSKISALANNEPTTEIYLEEPMLKMIAKMSESHEKGIAQAVSGLKLINVKEFKIDSVKKEKFAETMESLNKELQSKQWERIIRTKQKEEMVNVYIKKEADEIFSGLVVTALRKNGTAAFVNIVGKIDLATIGKISGEFKLPGLEGMKKDKDKE